MSPKSNTSKSKTSSSTLKQGKLSFTSSKRTASAKAAQKPKITPTKASLSPLQSPQVAEITLDEDVSEKEEIIQTKEQGKHRTIVSTVKEESTKDQIIESAVQKVELNEKDPKWRVHHAAVREKMGHLIPIHAQGQNKIHEILRVFDMSFEYGPCVGVTRLERWERAFGLGLGPPDEVHQILTTRQGIEDPSYSQSVLNGEV